jgi:hypothetical protein
MSKIKKVKEPKTKFTPGPWYVSVGNKGSIFGDLNNPVHNGDNPYIGTVAGIGVDQDIPECTANAKLIAAAPDLFAACVEFCRKVEVGEARSTASYEQMKAAIEKATK